MDQKNTLSKFLESSQKSTRGESYFSRVADFYRSSLRRCTVKKGVCRKVFAKVVIYGEHSDMSEATIPVTVIKEK